MDGIDFIERVVQQYRARTGVLPTSWNDVIRARLLRAVPADPTGTPFQLDPSTGNMKAEYVPNSQFTELPWDYLHPNHAGYTAMGEAIDLAFFASHHH